ncbi:MAG: ribonuclease H-like domain-containing protein [Xanthomonadaceae bacterium]|nr:ribonuclease H-like domain-containing protein [Xanthomonadaceae bacterium]
MATTPATRIKLNPSYWRHSSNVPMSEDVVPSSLFLKHRHYLVFDIETQKLVDEVGGWDHIDKLGVSVACAYDSKSQEMLTFRENELKNLFRLMEERLVIGYNIRGFDLPVLGAYGLEYKDLDTFDIMYDLHAITRGPFLKLDSVAQGTLNVGKSADGLLAVQWWKSGEIDKIIEYCLQDVKVTKDVFNYGREKGFVKIQYSEGNIKQVPVNWS